MRIGIVDTTFARVDMAKYAIDEILSLDPNAVIERYTVPGFKNTPWAAKFLLTKRNCDAAMVFGWIGPKLVDKITYAVASIGLMIVQLELNKPIVDVTVHEDEAADERELYRIAIDRARKHSRNLVLMLRNELIRWAGKGLRQGYPDVGPIVP